MIYGIAIIFLLHGWLIRPIVVEETKFTFINHTVFLHFTPQNTEFLYIKNTVDWMRF